MVRKYFGEDESSDPETTISFEALHQQHNKDSTTTIEVFSLTKVFKYQKVINEVSFNASRGEVIALLGYSGAGKSVLLNMLSGLAAPTTGDALILKRSVVTELDLVYKHSNIGVCQ